MTTVEPTLAMQPQYSIVPVQSAPLATVTHAAATTALQPYTPQLPPHMYYHPPIAPMPAPKTEGNETLVSLGDIIRWLRRYWLLGVAIALPLAGATFYLLGFGKKVYQAEAMMQVQIQDDGLLKLGKDAASISELSAPQIINNHRTGLKTRRFIDFLFTKIDKEQRDQLLAPLGGISWRTKLLMSLGLKGAPKAMTPEDLFNKLIAEAVRVEPVKDSHVLRVIVTGGDSQMVADIANHYVNDYIDYVANDSVESAKWDYEQLTAKVVENKRNLDAAEKELADFNQSADLLKNSESSDMTTVRAQNLERARSDVEVDLLRAQERVRQLRIALEQGQDVAGIKGLGDDGQIIEIRKKMIEAKSKRDALLEWCGPRHPKLLRTIEEIAGMERDATSRINAIIVAAESDEQRLQSEQAALTKKLSSARDEAFGQSDARIRQKQIRDKVESLRQLHLELTQHQDRARLASELRSNGSLTVKDVAMPPDEPISPKKSIAFVAAMMVFGLVSLVVPVGAGFGYQHLIPLVKKAAASEGVPDEEEEPEAAPPSVESPFHPTPPPPPAGAHLPPAQTGMYLPEPSLNAGIVASIPELMAGEGPVQLSELLHPNPLNGANAISPISTLLERHHAVRQRTSLVLVTSADMGEGKSMVCSALAASLCATGRSVFLMECNPSAPSIQNWFPQASGHSSWTNDLEALRYGFSNLFLLPAHDLPSYEMADLLDGYRAWVERAVAQGIDWIIMDCASLLRGFADVAQLAPMATDILFIHDQTRCSTEDVKAALNLLRPLVTSDALRGMVLNRDTSQNL